MVTVVFFLVRDCFVACGFVPFLISKLYVKSKCIEVSEGFRTSV